MGQPSIYHATVALSFQIEICNLDRTKSSFLATSLYKKVIFTKNWVTRSCRPSDDMRHMKIEPYSMLIWHFLWRQLLLRWYLRQQRVRVRVMIGFFIWDRIRIKVRVRVRVKFIVSLYHWSNWRAQFQNQINSLLMKIYLLTSLYRITLELVTEWNFDPDNSHKYIFF